MPEQTAGEQMVSAFFTPAETDGYHPRLMNVFVVELTGRGDYRERALTGWPLDLVILPRGPVNEREQAWINNQLRTRLVPGGRLVVATDA